ncbi:hypothetical protein B0H17DRAFT_1179431 [Mycena rosella]|uniref:SAP domain-containing protein n=1 Tax=Mycena rosella TaxID=1033263 RepID=A0AAD7GI23_MYCRO|nr:hypothetical protein B0H17DRAFT_1179431 [Mycena rosella]
MLVILIMHFGASTLQVDRIQEGRAGDELRVQHKGEAQRRGADEIGGRKKMVRLFRVGNCLFAGSLEKQIICPKEKRTPGGVSLRCVAARAINFQIPLVDDPPSPAYTLGFLICLLPVLNLCGPAAWGYLERAWSCFPYGGHNGGHSTHQQLRGGSGGAAGHAALPDKNWRRRGTYHTKEQLKEMCRDYGRAVSGNKTQLQARLQEYSEAFCNDPSNCNLLPVKRRSHKGPREGPETSQPKQSASRRAVIIDTERVTERSKDTRTSDQMKDLLIWADRTLASLPYKPPQPVPEAHTAQPVVPSQGVRYDQSLHDRMHTIENQLAAISSGPYQASAHSGWDTSAALTAHPIAPSDYIVFDPTTRSISYFPSYYDTDNIIFNNPSDGDWMPAADYHNLHIVQRSDGGYGTSPSLPSTHTVLPTAAASPFCPPAAPIPPASNSPTRSFTFGDHTTITITVDEVMKIAVSATSFAEDIDRLNQMWDDTSPYWKNDSVVKIDTHSIALIYWPDLFKKTGLWSAHKSNWTEWKVRVGCGSATITDVILLSSSSSVTDKEPQRSSGQHLLPATALKCLIPRCVPALREERKNADSELANRARLEYGEVFKLKFSYRCSRTNARVVMTKATSIAKEYKRLQSL